MGDGAPAASIITHFKNLRLPPELDLTSGHVSENLKTWKRQVEIYLSESGTTQVGNKVQIATILKLTVVGKTC
jgi:hypothetical protein